MNKPLSGWQLFGVFIVLFIIFGVVNTKEPGLGANVVGAIADIVLLTAIIVGIRNHHRSRSGK